MLDKVIIPEVITVHLDKPTIWAENVSIPFKDYIKNVATCELYSTWPSQALIANILCIISLALNRVYTEWYRSQGFDFDITNSTKYDQSYSKNIEIPLSISTIVDKIYNVYICKTGEDYPYYAEYCDGKKVTCPGVEQWKTVELSDEGFDAMSILRFFYGDDINVCKSNNSSSIKESYCGIPLKKGSTGRDVTKSQTYINRISDNYPRMPLISVTGIFDTETELAIKQFQEIFNLSIDGVIGRLTWYKISYIYVSVRKLAELDSQA